MTRTVTLYRSHRQAVLAATALRSNGATVEIRDGVGGTYAVVSWAQ